MIPDTTPKPIAETIGTKNNFHMAASTSYFAVPVGPPRWSCDDCGFERIAFAATDGLVAAVLHAFTCGQTPDTTAAGEKGDTVAEMKRFLKPHIDAVLADQEADHDTEMQRLRTGYSTEVSQLRDTVEALKDAEIDANNEAGAREEALRDQIAELESRVATDTGARRVAEARDRNAALRAEVTRADTKAGMIAGPLAAAVAVSVVSGTIHGLTPVAEAAGWTAAGLGLVAAGLCGWAVKPRFRAGGLGIIAQPASCESDAGLADELEAGQAALASIATTKHRSVNRGLLAAAIAIIPVLVALIATGIGI